MTTKKRLAYRDEFYFHGCFSLTTLREELHVLANESNFKSVTKKTEYVYLEERDAL